MSKRRGNSEGSIYRDRDGRWRGAVSLGWKVNAAGKSVADRKILNGKTRAEVQEKLTDALKRRQQGLPLVGERQTLGQFLEYWLDHVAKTKVRPKTFASYQWIIKRHLIPVLGRNTLAKLSPQMIQTFMNEQSKSGRVPRTRKPKSQAESTTAANLTPTQSGALTPRTVQHIHATLRTALDQAEQWGLVVRNAAKLVDAPRVRRAEIQPFSPDEAKTFLAAIQADRLEALYSVAMALGLRQGEALGLCWSDVDLDGGTLTVQHALQRIDGRLQLVEPKTQKSRRTVNLPKFAIAALCRHKSQRETERRLAGERWKETPFIFTTTIGTPMDGSTVTHRFQAALKAVGLRRIRFHDLRHSAASLLLAQGVHPKVVQEIGGWSNIQIVLDTYSHIIPALKSEAAEKMDAILFPVASSVASKPENAKVN